MSITLFFNFHLFCVFLTMVVILMHLKSAQLNFQLLSIVCLGKATGGHSGPVVTTNTVRPKKSCINQNTRVF